MADADCMSRREIELHGIIVGFGLLSFAVDVCGRSDLLEIVVIHEFAR